MEGKIEIKIEKREPRTEVLAYRVTEDEAKKIKECAEKNGVKVPNVIRSALKTTGVI